MLSRRHSATAHSTQRHSGASIVDEILMQQKLFVCMQAERAWSKLQSWVNKTVNISTYNWDRGDISIASY